MNLTFLSWHVWDKRIISRGKQIIDSPIWPYKLKGVQIVDTARKPSFPNARFNWKPSVQKTALSHVGPEQRFKYSNKFDQYHRHVFVEIDYVEIRM